MSSPATRAAGMYVIATPDELAAATAAALDTLQSDEAIGPLASAYQGVLEAAGRRMAKAFKAQAVTLRADAEFTAPDEDEVVDGDRLRADLEEALGKAHQDAARVVVSALDDEGVTFDIDTVFTDELIRGLGEQATFAADNELRSIYRNTLTVAAKYGESVPTTAEMIRNTVGAMAPHRARALARTDLNGLANGGSVHVAQTALGKEQPVYKRWLATDDERTRDTHIDADGQTVGVHENFTVGFASLPYPGFPFGPPEEVINCRCTVTYTSDPHGGDSVVRDPQAGERDPLALVTPSDDMLEAINRDWERWTEGEYQVDMTTHMRSVEESLTQQLSPNNVSLRIRTPKDVALEVVNDGRFQNQFESQSSRGMFAPSARRTMEGELFSYPEATAGADRPIYGYLGGVTREDGPVQQYGDVVWQLKNDVRARTTWTANDSLAGNHAPSPIDRPSALSFNPRAGHGPGIDPLATSLIDYGEFDSLYVEAQYHGGVTLDDVERVIVYYVDPGYEGTGMAADTWRREAEATAKELRSALAGRGIEVEVRAFPRSGLSSSGEHGLSQLEHGLGIDAGEVVSPVAASDDAEGGHLRPDRAGGRVEYAHRRRLQRVAAALGEEHERGLAPLADDLHTSDLTSTPGGSHQPQTLRLTAMQYALPTTALARALPTAELERMAVNLDMPPEVMGPPAPSERDLLAAALAGRAADMQGLTAALEALAVAVATPPEPPVVHVHVPEQQLAAPVVHVQVPEQPAPVVQLAEGQPPVVNVTVDVPPAQPVVNVEVPPPPLREIEFERDGRGLIVRAEEVA